MRFFTLLLVGFLTVAALPFHSVHAAATLEENLNTIVSIACGDIIDGEPVPIGYGSGVVLDTGLVLTNAHVSNFEDVDGVLYEYDWCLGGIAENAYQAPDYTFGLAYEGIWEFNEFYDYEFLSAFDLETGEPIVFEHVSTYGNADSLVHGDEITLIGYPGVTEGVVTSTFGNVSGFSGTNWIITDAAADFGNSGGGAFDANGNLIGLPTIVVAGDLNSVTYILNINEIILDAFGPEVIVRDYDTIYTTDNVTCFPIEGECYQFGEGAEIDLDETAAEVEGDEQKETDADFSELDQMEDETNGFVLEGNYDPSKHDQGLVDRLAGYVLLQAESNGEAWYLNPTNSIRYYMKDGATAYRMLESFGLGISTDNLERIPEILDVNDALTAENVCETNAFAASLAGRVLLQVEAHGEAFYVHPDTCQRVYLKDGENTYQVLRLLSLGVSNENLTRIPSGVL